MMVTTGAPEDEDLPIRREYHSREHAIRSPDNPNDLAGAIVPVLDALAETVVEYDGPIEESTRAEPWITFLANQQEPTVFTQEYLRAWLAELVAEKRGEADDG